MDLALNGKVATVAAIEQDYEGRHQLAVVLADDPGKDLGLMRQPGHQFFFQPEEIEPIEAPISSTEHRVTQAKVLVAGIGNIFLGDDAFGVEVVRRILARGVPAGVQAVDFGIRGYDLAYALLEPYEVVILIDACPRGGLPGTLYVIEPDLESLPAGDGAAPAFDAHVMNPMNVLRLAKLLGPIPNGQRILLLGCEPLTLGPEEGQLGISDEVSAALDNAVTLLQCTISRALSGALPGVGN